MWLCMGVRISILPISVYKVTETDMYIQYVSVATWTHWACQSYMCTAQILLGTFSQVYVPNHDAHTYVTHQSALFHTTDLKTEQSKILKVAGVNMYDDYNQSVDMNITFLTCQKNSRAICLIIMSTELCDLFKLWYFYTLDTIVYPSWYVDVCA